MPPTHDDIADHTPSRPTNALLWAAQALLAAAFLFAGGTKLFMPVAELTRQTPLPGAFLRATGVVELLGGLGLVLPGLLRLRAVLTPLAAAGLVLVMCGATGATLASATPATGGPVMALIPVAFGVVLAAVAYGRWRVAPHGAAVRVAPRAGVVRPAAA